MAVTYGFYNSQSNDRQYDAVQFGQMFDGIIYDGVFSKVGDAFNVEASATPDLNVTVGTGRAWFNNTWTYNDSGLVIAIPQGHVAYPRIDSIVLQVNEETRINSISRKPGPEESIPEPPVLTNTSTIHEYRLANIYVAAGATVITQANITLLVGTGNTPFVTGPLTTISADSWLAQWEAEWDYWFNYIMGELDSEVAGNLQNQITAIRGSVGDPPITLLALTTHDHAGGGDGNQISTAGIANDAIDDTKVGNRVSQFRRRQGGNSADWSVYGTTNYTPTTVRKVAGVRRISIGDGWNGGSGLVTFPPDEFSNKPIVTCLALVSDAISADIDRFFVTNISASGMTINAHRPSTSGAVTIDISWEVTGPE